MRKRARVKRKYRLVKDQWDYYMNPSRGVSRFVRDFNVVGKSFSLGFIPGNCYQVLHPDKGCSLYLEGLSDLDLHHKDDKNNVKHCPYIRQLMEEDPERMFFNKRLPVNVTKYGCDHYSTGQGQHRICINGLTQKKMPLVFYCIRIDLICPSCEFPNGMHTLKHF